MFSYPINEDVSLRLLEVRDAEPLYAVLRESESYLRRWLPFLDNVHSVQDIIQFIESGLARYAHNNGGEIGIWYHQQFAGVVGIHFINWTNRTTSLGYWLGEKFQGHGIMTQACGALIRILFEEYDLHRVEIQAAVDNMKSRAIPERLGFRQEGVLRQTEWLYDHYVDHVVYGLLKDDWLIKNTSSVTP
ncbi:MAG: RimJ/RimL family protein N-acetyltransferase [Sulfobacillus thermosulfidooxidans]|uniref:RimJ/RimL family protein N-acetyltransferase n=1 Tax=Sulfobacillus thermosulfidooxidans TaxID=28034 RepID=A0A2T2WQM6_SULTH|nr:MAG: RimJ/RimL family protein N-acetyltransferase [Sulfobacillus thermosulfidooxidans]